MTRRPTPVIETARLRLRARTPDDAEALFTTFADPERMRWWSHAPHRTVEETRAALSDRSDGWRSWTITRQGDDHALGFVAAGERRQGDVSEIGYMLAREAASRGLASEAVAAVIDQIFAEGQRRVIADSDPDNQASRALLERLGFRLEGILREEWETHIGVRNTALYGLLAREWRNPINVNER